MPSLSSRFSVLKTRPRSVVLLPDHRFFVRSVPVSRDVEAGTEREQIELALEAMAPFPLSQLYWGYWTKAGCERALVFAAYKKRFTADATEDWAEAEWVAPRFGALLASEAPAPATTWILRSDEGLTALHFGDESGVPTRVTSVELSDEATETQISAAREHLIKTCGGSRSVEDIDELEVDPGQPGDDALDIRHGAAKAELSLDRAQRLDVRDQDELSARRRARVRDTWAWRTVVAALVVLLLSALGEATLFGLELWQKGRRARVAAQTPIVNEIETAERLASRIEELRTQRLRPFEMIALVDQPRPESIVFLETRAIGLYTMEIEAETDNQADVNVYINALQQLAGTESVESLGLNARGARATLTLRVNFSPDAFDTAAPPPPEEAMPPPASEEEVSV
ncbi:hypothetical protein [Actomonas aquatica]|uniref:GspL cytoplasmic actin-ATPase-like domain-containing protein n=1 Tax=Actomonas aquatica TaxID=2866162 RepID=A0ABZ1C6B6_9BACT|nr:hypothetical protein [Opitutus sp. WL0086]WRQ87001.1 hypothetical protein K1X11_019480 [Opitutus sp. WL0086]